jgi:hypothetical protein
MLRSLHEIQPDFAEEAKAKAGLVSQGKKKKKKLEFSVIGNGIPLCLVTARWGAVFATKRGGASGGRLENTT